MSSIAVVAFLVLPMLGFILAAHRYGRYRNTERVPAVVVSLGRAHAGKAGKARKARAGEAVCEIEFTYQDRRWRAQLSGAEAESRQIGDTLTVYFPKGLPGSPAKPRVWDLRGFWIALMFCLAPALVALLLLGDFWLAREMHARAFDPARTHYVAANASVLLHPFAAVFPLLASLLFWQAFRHRRRSWFDAITRFGLPGLVVTVVTAHWILLDWQAMQRCTSPDALASSERIEGVIDDAGPIQNLRGRATNRLAIHIQGRRFESAGFRNGSECGFRASVAQSMPLPTGTRVEMRVVGDMIVELRRLQTP